MIIMAIARCRNRRREVNKKALLEQRFYGVYLTC
ncbi:hypothetical protein FOT90_24110 [Klebsiella aerogenes]|jgi:hypothetical protein|nr:hypothetical protein [Klebsiella aerogenes]MBE0250457.1 hypothetical protein [Klebsiella aerogenes]QDK16226.1 hypothetical protein ES159_23045 [Klebsiella aerogenes]RFS93819.1 hypothetical protein CH426_16225 [Klebsiella aerogenes]